MNIQFNTDKTINASEKNTAPFMVQIIDELSRFSTDITRIEVHLSDENGNKDGLNDIRCLLEARLEGKQPIAVTNQADTPDQALSGAIDKLKASLETITGKGRNY
ncbi:ribosome-associated translation inhibitor RaiA [Pedobacter sp. AK017]|uniref:HPF/RaiA family ribosome-associated protein n=1 Tax=Pedobacter sp. AK017 TaxID=2723073 RepID=UPI00161C3169|nr:HPF/RaiA family ribosome-associated protein [Pedobacter sp. AK017]MBB5438113.1 ribosome-associated translation inhibitor RaiA [Pedobacter sp. AK017]